MRGNPHTGTGVYYPQCAPVLYAYHSVEAGYRKVQETEQAFRNIWTGGRLMSSRERLWHGITNRRSLLFATDVIAGDDDYVFLSPCKPHGSGSLGYDFVFDAISLVERNGAVVGLFDMTHIYGRLADRLGINRIDASHWPEGKKKTYMEESRYLASYFRLNGIEARQYLEWLLGLRKRIPINAEVLRWANREFGLGLGESLHGPLRSRLGGIANAEILVPRWVPLEELVGVIFRKDWTTIEEFVAFFGSPGQEPKAPLIPKEYEHWVKERTGVPVRCPFCSGWVELPLGQLPEDVRSSQRTTFHSRMKAPGFERPVDVWVCHSCGSAFLRPMSYDDVPEPRIGHIEELEYVPWKW